MFINSIATNNIVIHSFLPFLLSIDCFLYIIRCIVKNMLDISDITLEKFKDNMPGPDWENYFIKVFKNYLKNYLKIYNLLRT